MAIYIPETLKDRLPIEDFKEYPHNAKLHDIDKMRSSMREFGFLDPVGVYGNDNLILEGHGRLEAAKLEGMTELPYFRITHLTEEQARAYRLVHNQVNLVQGFDVDALKWEIEDLEFDIAEWGFANFADEEIDMSGFEEDGDSSTNKDLIKCPECGHINDKRAFANYE